MVGDDLQGDIVGSSSAGCRAVLVRTGKFQQPWNNSSAPSAVVDALSDAAALLIQAKEGWQ